MKTQKEEQREEEIDNLGEFMEHSLEALFKQASLLQRTTALSSGEATGIVVGAFMTYAAKLAVETNQSKVEFLQELGEEYDTLSEEFNETIASATGDDDDDDKPDDGPQAS
jgi:hypothetical protein